MLIQAIENQIFRKAAPQAINYLTKPDLNTQEPISRQVLDQAAKEFQLAPPVTLHSSDPDLMAGLWAVTRETFIVNVKGRAIREAIAEAVSNLNQCPYCVTIHKSMGMSVHGNSVTNEQAVEYQWALSTLSPTPKTINESDIAPNDISQVFGTAIVYHYINRLVTIFLHDAPVALPGMMTKPGQKIMQSTFVFFGRRITKLDPEPGQFILDIEAELPDEFSWALPNRNIGKAFSQFSWAAEKAGDEAVHEEVKLLLLDHLSNWQGEEAPLSRSWVEDLIAPLDDKLKPSARLVLLTARAPWQIDKTIIADFLSVTSNEKKLLQTVSWASFVTVKRIASWLKAPTTT